MALMTKEVDYPMSPAPFKGPGVPTPRLLKLKVMNPSEHFVQFYERDESLMDTVTGFIASGIEAGESCIVIGNATAPRGSEKGYPPWRECSLGQRAGQYVSPRRRGQRCRAL